MIIYLVTNLVNGKKYVGMTTLTLEQRRREHFKNSKLSKRKQALYHAFNKYGTENFKWEEICSTWSRDYLMELEIQFIKEFDTLQSGYNMTVGGDGVIASRYQDSYKLQFPDGTIQIVVGFKQFCRNNNLNEGALWLTWKSSTRRYTKQDGTVSVYTAKSKHHKGFVLIGKFND